MVKPPSSDAVRLEERNPRLQSVGESPPEQLHSEGRKERREEGREGGRKGGREAGRQAGRQAGRHADPANQPNST